MHNLVKRRVHLHGYLGEKFGEHFDLAVRSPAEAIRLLEANFPGEFARTIHDGMFSIVIGDFDRDEGGASIPVELVPFKFSSGDFHIVPAVRGAGGMASGGRGKGILMVIVGVALIATAFIGAAVFAGGAGMWAGMSAGIMGTSVTWSNVAMLGAALALSGAASLLTPQPKDNKVETTGDSRKQSFFFNGAVNITEEGTPVPVIYGRVLAGSVVVSAGVYSERLDPYSSTSPINEISGI